MDNPTLQRTPAVTIDLDAYFRRIGYEGAGRPTLDTLAAIQVRHTETIAFENLSP
jgi:N-hydroxyarylamine O-acetyltransferase